MLVADTLQENSTCGFGKYWINTNGKYVWKQMDSTLYKKQGE